jgi:N-acetylglucosaminyl-diphospho-decaprenol L-rhamnosyltransferase
MRLLIVIVNYRTADLTIDCLRSVRDEVTALSGARVVVTDNASGDDSAERIALAIFNNAWRDWVQFVPLDRNGGFAYGNNAAIRPALVSNDPPDYVLLLNPDTVARAGAIGALLDFMDAHLHVGIAGSRLEHPDGTPQQSAFRFPSALAELEGGMRLGLITPMLRRWNIAPPVPKEACRAEWVAGASMIIRRNVFDLIGLLDERYFMYFEEVDFCRRAAKAGWPCWYVPQSRVVHLVGQSSGVTDIKQANKPRPRYWFQSRRLFFLTHYGHFRTLLADMFWTAGYAQWRVRRAMFRKPDRDPAGLLRDFVKYNFLGEGKRAIRPRAPGGNTRSA